MTPPASDTIVVANAGSGKTTSLVQYYFNLILQGYDPSGIIVFTFTELAAGDLKEKILLRLKSHPEFKDLPGDVLHEWKLKILASPIGTIHQFCLRVIRDSFSPSKTLGLRIIEDAADRQLREGLLFDQLRERFLQEDPDAVLLLETYGIRDLRKLLREYLEYLDAFSSSKESATFVPLQEEEARLLQALKNLGRPLHEAIQKEKERRRWINFDDMERQALAALRDPAPSLKARLSLFTHALVDEFQDTSPIQIQILEALRHSLKALKRPFSLYCVGDPKQSIYRFRRVDRNLIAQTEREILREGGKKIDSVENYRSAPALVELVNRFADQAFPEALPSNPRIEDSPSTRTALVWIPVDEEKVSAEGYREREASWVAGEIESLLHGGISAGQIAVLYRASATAYPLMKELESRSIVFAVRGGRELLERQEVIDLKRLIYFLADPNDSLSLTGLLRSPLFLVSDVTLFFLNLKKEKDSLWSHWWKSDAKKDLPEISKHELEKLQWARSLLEQLLAQSRSLAPSELLKSLVHRLGLGDLAALSHRDPGSLLSQFQFLDWLKQMEEELAPISFKKIAETLRQLQDAPLNKTPLGDLIQAQDAVQLLTIHAAKGLEFDHVFLMGLDRKPGSDFPILQHVGRELALKITRDTEEEAKTLRYREMEAYHSAEEKEENKRLLYVAMTRAKQELMIALHPQHKNNHSLQSLLLKSLGSHAQKYFLKPPIEQTAVPSTPKPSEFPVFASKPPLPSTRKSDLTATVSELETFNTCALKHSFLYRRRLPDTPWSDPFSLDKAELGTVLHRALNQLHLHPQLSAETGIRQALEERFLTADPEIVTSLSLHLKNYQASAPSLWLREAEEDYSELPFLLQLKSGQIRGQIDRLVKWKGQWVLIDFKYTTSGASSSELMKNYAFQLKTYALAAKKFLGQELASVQIHLLSQGRSVEFHFSPEELGKHQELLERILSGMDHAELETIGKRPACFSCFFNQALPLCPVPRDIPWRESLIGS